MNKIIIFSRLHFVTDRIRHIDDRRKRLKQIQTPRYIVQNSMNLKQYRHRPSHDSSQCFNLFPASAEKIRKTYRLRKRVFGKNFHAKTIYNSFKQFYPVQKVSSQISTEKSPSENSNDF